MSGRFDFACPDCGGSLSPSGEDGMACELDGLRFQRSDGIWRFLLPERQAHYERFVREYETIRGKEGRGSAEADYYRALPYQDLSGRMAGDWRIRASSFDAFCKHVLPPLEKAAERPLVILDLGSGNGWLSYRLAERGHHLAAVDLTVNDFDGLGCWRFYDRPFIPVQAEFDHLPFLSHSIDLAVFNASFHYSESYLTTLTETLRVLKPRGSLVILDTPIYHHGESGEQMVGEREASFAKQFGFPSNALRSENYLTYEAIKDLGRLLHLKWEKFTPGYGLHWRLRPLAARLLGSREPAKFEVLVGKIIDEE